MAELRLTSLAGLPAGAKAAVRAIYEEAFPPAERGPFSQVVDEAAEGTLLADILLEDHEPLGLSFASVLAEAPALYLQFLAVRRDLRGGGLGRVLWDRAVLARAADTGAPGIVLEVEDPDVAAADAERRQALRRIVFYERLGASLLPVTGYRVPRADGPGELALRLMWAPAPGGPPGPPALRRLVMALYGEGYGLPAGHPLVVATEGDLPEPEEGGP